MSIHQSAKELDSSILVDQTQTDEPEDGTVQTQLLCLGSVHSRAFWTV